MKSLHIKLLLFNLFTILSFSAYTQNNFDSSKIDSLKKVLQTQKEDTNKINTHTLTKLSKTYNNINDSINEVKNLKQAIIVAEKISDQSALSKAYTDLAEYYFTINFNKGSLPQEVFIYLEKALTGYYKIKDTAKIISVYLDLSYAHFHENNFNESTNYLYEVLKKFEKYENKLLLGRVYDRLSIAYFSQNKFEEALKNSLQALAIFRQTGKEEFIAHEYITISTICTGQKDYDNAIKYSDSALKKVDSSDNLSIASIYWNLGISYENKQDSSNESMTKALTAYKLALDNAVAAQDSGGVSDLCIALGNIYLKKHDIPQARIYIQRSLKVALQLAYWDNRRTSYLLYSQLDSAEGNYKQAYEHYKLFKLFDDSLNDQEQSKKAVQAQMQYDFDKKEAIIKAAQDKKDAEAKQIKNQQYFTIGGLAIIVLATIIIAVIQYRNNKQKQKANILLQHQKEKVETTLSELKSTQSQLIQQEKMASLGQLTAGIAHEIQNPLNFVNNFSEVNRELIAEMKEEINKGNYDEVKIIANDVIENSEKINHHGKRAGDIVKGMLQHSRTSTGKKEPTDINALCNEYLRLSYNGLRAKDKDFNATMQTNFDESIGKINIVPQDIGRVILNLINNAFYAVNEKKKTANENYEPTVLVSTKKVNDKILISVKDNGNGIPQKIVDKIFQPFFTTKPTGSGTGLGLSLSYDIIKAHGGEIKVNTKEGEGSEFIVQLPITA